MDRYSQRAMFRLFAYLGVALVAICYGAYQANPKLAIACGIGIGLIGCVAWVHARYQENQVKKMVAEIDAMDRKS